MIQKLALFILVVQFLVSPLCSASLYRDDYDRHFQSATNNWLPGVDWKLVKAQAVAESTLNPKAESFSGAKGLMQLMPGTAKEVMRQLGIRQYNLFHVDTNITAGVYYMQRMRATWTKFFDPDRHNMALASYNAGPGVMLNAYRKCKGDSYSKVSACIPLVTNKAVATQALGYVLKIRKIYSKILLGL